MDPFRKQVAELWARWQALSVARKAVWVAGVSGCFALAGLLYWAAQPEYRVLYAGLSAEEAGIITSKLQTKGIPFKLGAGGSSISVPADQTMQAHVDMTAEGVGSAKIGKGFELLDQPMLGATPQSQRINLIRAQQAELARTIMQIDPIVFARVHLTAPDSSPFARDQKPTTASVMVKLRNNATLNRNAVTSIAALVSGSVEGLSKDSVRIVDATGRLLSVERDPDTGSVGTFMEIRRDVEHHLSKEAEHMLEMVLGPGKAIVRVTADLDTKLMKKKEEKINAEGKIPRTEKTTLTKTTSGGTTKGGPAGSASNLSKTTPTPGPPSGGSSTTETQQYDYDYPRTVIEWQNKHGSIERLTIAAFVDSEALKNSEPAISVKDVEEAIKKAVGYKADRDEIQVTSVKMPTINPESLDEDSASHNRLQQILTIVRNVSICVIALCVLPMAWMLFRRRMAASSASAAPNLKIADEFDHNPEALAKVLSHWMAKSETADRKAA